MAGQGVSADFDVTDLIVIEPLGAADPADIIPEGGDFTLRATFTGSGSGWQGYQNLEAHYVVKFYVEGLGETAPDKDIGNVGGDLIPGNTDSYIVELPVIGGGGLTEGVYKVACLVRFPDVPGMTGYFDTRLMEIYIP